MTYIYQSKDNSLVQKAEMERPIAPPSVFAYGQHEEYYNRDMYNHECNLEIYNAHIASLKTISCDPSCIGVLEDGKEYTENVHFEISSNEDRLHRAFPLQPPVSEEGPLKGFEHLLPILSNVHDRTGIEMNWLWLWSEIENWYGDIKKKETAEELLLRMQSIHTLKRK